MLVRSMPMGMRRHAVFTAGLLRAKARMASSRTWILAKSLGRCLPTAPELEVVGDPIRQRAAISEPEVELAIEEAIRGGKKRLILAGGKPVDVTVPPGVSEGAVLRLKGQGEPGAAGPGDVLIEIAFAQHPIFQRRNGDLIMDLPVSVPDAVLGGTLPAPTPEGEVTLRIPPGANSGAMLRLKGRGLTDQSGRRGDLLARVVVTLPQQPDPELVSFCEVWKRDRPYATPKPGAPSEP